jgi:hypothetical protein
VADLDALYICDGIVGAGSAVEGYAEIASAGLGLGGCGEGESKDDED